MKPQVLTESIPWQPHPSVPGIEIKALVSKAETGLDLSCLLVRIPAGSEAPEHIHEAQDDIIYPLQGKATMWVDGEGDFPLEPGVFVRVPKGTRHRVYDVKEDLLVYDVFFPALM
ncbi:MAG: cupin domain-containing protein [Desulfobacterales bacterium]|nr:cupin domain-containing protein [Desulfobacterales bacterium]